MAINRLLIISILFALCSCSGNVNVPEYEQDEDTGEVVFNMSPMTRSQIENTHAYVFNGVTPDLGGYVYRVPGLTYSGSNISMSVKAGTWNMVLVNTDQSVLGQLSQPYISSGVTMYNTKMWETTSSGLNLPSMPEIMTAHINGQVVNADQMNTGSADMVRNVAMVKVVVKEAGGLANGNDNHTISLSNVPTMLSWAGGLLPDKDNPTVSNAPMSGEVTISTDPLNSNNQVSNELVFLIPAHKGSDWDDANPEDTTTSKLKLSVNFGVTGSGRYEKSEVEVPVTPKMNKILVLELIVKAQLTINAQIHDWIDEYTDADISQTGLSVSKTEVGLSYKDTVTVNTSAGYYSVLKGADWITTEQLSDGRLVITANTNTYTAPRSSYVNIVTNNVTKRIAVTQRPDEGTITAPASFWVSPTANNTYRDIVVNSTGPWTITSPNPTTVTPNRTSGSAGNTTVRFTRKSHTGNISDYTQYYGSSTFTIKNTQTLEVITITADNLFMAFENIVVGNSEGVNTNTMSDPDVICLGGNVLNPGLYTVFSKPSWVTSSTVAANGSLTIVAPGSPDGDSRTGQITFMHNTDPTYKITVDLEQRLTARIPPFDYFTVKFQWGGGTTGDVDIRAYFTGNGVAAIDNKPLGYGLSGASGYSANGVYLRRDGTVIQSISGNWTAGLLYWGGDARAGQGEQVFFNAPMVDNDNTLPRKLTFAVEAYRYATTLTITVQALKHTEGAPATVITHSNYNFSFTNVTEVYSKQQSIVITSVGHKVVDLVYDRLLHNADINFYNAP